ncbi:hypothetical protein D3C86_2002100 [compost metagenome]
MGEPRQVEAHPDHHDQRLCTEKSRCAEEPRKGFGAQGKLVIAECWREVGMGTMETQVIDVGGGFVAGGHDALCLALGLKLTIASAPVSF